ncbi:MAG: hypothetical protein V1859_08245 [archaeon]
MRKGQLVSMDLVFGFIIFIITISIFFYAIGGIDLLKQKKSLAPSADFIFNNLETIPDDRIAFLKDYKINSVKLALFAQMTYMSASSDGDIIKDSWQDAQCTLGTRPTTDCDTDTFSDYDELRKGTNPSDGAYYPKDGELDGSEPVGDGLDDWWEANSARNIDSYPSPANFDAWYEDLDEDDTMDTGYSSEFNMPPDPTNPQLECRLSYDFIADGDYNEDNNYNFEIDGESNEDLTGFWLNGMQGKCNFLGYVNNYEESDNIIAVLDPPIPLDSYACQKCLPNLWFYKQQLAKGDFDNDGLNDINEINLYSAVSYTPCTLEGNPLSKGAIFTLDALGITCAGSSLDGDSLPDEWENKYGLEVNTFNKMCGVYYSNQFYDPCTYGDPDNDWLSNWDELKYGTDPLNPDTDGDGINDLYDPIVPLASDMQDLVLGDITKLGFSKVDMCIYVEDKTGNILAHVGKGNVADNNIFITNTLKCGTPPTVLTPPITANPQCKTSPYIETIVMSRPVLYQVPGGTSELANLKVLICASK